MGAQDWIAEGEVEMGGPRCCDEASKLEPYRAGSRPESPHTSLTQCAPTMRLTDFRANPAHGWRQHAHPDGGADRDRTDDLCSAIAALSQLSYGPSPRVHDLRAAAAACQGTGANPHAARTHHVQRRPEPNRRPVPARRLQSRLSAVRTSACRLERAPLHVNGPRPSRSHDR